MKRFEDSCVLITGGRSGIGQACARKFSKEGAQVFIAQRNPSSEFETIIADLSDPSAPQHILETIIARSGRLDILVNNSGVMTDATVEEMSLKAWEHTMAVNLTAPFLLTKYALPHLKITQGAIVNIGSIEALGSNPTHPAYCASKAGLHGLTRAVAVDHGPDGVRCNCIAPGWIDTDLNLDYIAAMPDPQHFRDKISAIHPMSRTGLPADVASMVLWLASQEASFVTGQTFVVDGGRTAKLSLP